MAIMNRLSVMWNNAFRTNDQALAQYPVVTSLGPSTSTRPYALRGRFTNEKTIISSIYTRIGIDFAGIEIRHIKLDDANRYLEDSDSSLNKCFVLQPNMDQGPRAFRQEIATTLCDNGVIAIVPVNTVIDPQSRELLEIKDLRIGTVCAWFPKHIRVSLYNEERGERQEILVEKKHAAIVENPLFAVMNEPNSTLKRLVHKLSLLDIVDDASSSGKLDLIIQLPYAIKTEARRQQAEQRREDIEFQLKGTKYGIAYTDGTEKITQLNRPTENNLLKQVTDLTAQLYSELGITPSVMDGTADEATMINYFNRTIKPFLVSTTEAMQRSFLGVKGFDNKERILFLRDPFSLVPVSQLADIADKFTRNEILSSNEVRQVIGFSPHPDPKADQLVNSNMPQPVDQTAPMLAEMDSAINDALDGITSDINDMVKGLSNG